jgi:hypothetical protein
LENLQLHTGISVSEYVNKFMAWYHDLEKIKCEGMSASHVVSVFLRNITDTDYQTTVTYCLNSNGMNVSVQFGNKNAISNRRKLHVIDLRQHYVA